MDTVIPGMAAITATRTPMAIHTAAIIRTRTIIPIRIPTARIRTALLRSNNMVRSMALRSNSSSMVRNMDLRRNTDLSMDLHRI